MKPGAAAFIYTYAPQTGESGLAGARASDGATVWRFTYPPNQAELVIVTDGVVYLSGTTAAPGSPFGGDAMEVCALNVSDGSVRWRHPIQQAQLLAEPVATS